MAKANEKPLHFDERLLSFTGIYHQDSLIGKKKLKTSYRTTD